MGGQKPDRVLFKVRSDLHLHPSLKFLSSARGEADSSVVQSSSMKMCQGKAEQGGGFGFLAMESPIDFSCTGFSFLLLAAQSTSLKEAQEIFKSKQ